MTKAEQRKRAVKLTLPVFCGYIVLGIAFGATLAQAGYGPVWALAISTLVYAGSLQFVMVPFLAGGTSLIAVALTALMVNARHLFYGLSCIERFGRMDKRIRPYDYVPDRRNVFGFLRPFGRRRRRRDVSRDAV